MNQSTLVVRSKSGRLLGFHEGNGIRVWRGIPYALPVSLTGRFLTARPCEPWEGTRDARRFGPVSPQGGTGTAKDPEMSEDCHFLNIWSPEGATALPVMVWIHGGAYMSGSGSMPDYDGARLAEAGPVVVVTFNYRLGYLGFLDLSGLPGSEGRFQANLGLRDQITALQWVKDHIADFGGNPDNVTIFGESAGGGSVCCLLASREAKGLFHAAIAQSPPAASVYTPEQSQIVTQVFLDELSLKEVCFNDFLAQDVRTLVDAGRRIAGKIADLMPGHHPFQPRVDGDVVQDFPLQGILRGTGSAVPLLIGSNEDEGSLFANPPLPPLIPARAPNSLVFLRQNYPEREHEILAAYEGYGRFGADVAIGGDGMVVIPALRLAEAQGAQAPVWVYRLRWSSGDLMEKKLGTPHSLDVPLVFGQYPADGLLDPSGPDGARMEALSVRMQRIWTSFAAQKRPDSGSQDWPVYFPGKRWVLVLDDISTTWQDPASRQRRVWG